MKHRITIISLSGLLMGWSTSDVEIVKVTAPKIKTEAGQQSVINVSVDVTNGYHIQAHKVKNEFMVPTTLEIKGNDSFALKKQVFPSTKKFKLEGTDEYLDVYDGRFEIQTFLITQKQTQKGFYTLIGKLKYQACDSMRCLFPRTVDFSIEVEVQ